VLTTVAALALSCALSATTSVFGDARDVVIDTGRADSDAHRVAPVTFLNPLFWPELNADVRAVDAEARLLLATPAPSIWPEPNSGPSGHDGTQSAVQIAAAPAQPEESARQRVAAVTSSPAAAPYEPPPRIEMKVGRISFDTPSLAPMAFVRFCLKYPRDCEVRQATSPAAPEPLTGERMAELVKVNREVNRAIEPEANSGTVADEEWLVSPRSGDCNDYAVTKRHDLLARGWPSQSLLLAEVVLASGEHHLVLIVRTRDDDFVLDNLNWNVRPVSQIRYRWVRAQQADNPKYWSAISVATAARVAMKAR
jgi:predicted transglutaminase-like cysteine proteinase